MNVTDLHEGDVIRLVRPVKNPKADRRKRYDLRAIPVWGEDRRFIVRFSPERVFGADKIPGEPYLEFEGHPGYTLASWHNPVGLAAVIANAEPADVTLDSVVAQVARGWSLGVAYEEIVKWAILQGKLSLDDVREALESVEDD